VVTTSGGKTVVPSLALVTARPASLQTASTVPATTLVGGRAGSASAIGPSAPLSPSTTTSGHGTSVPLNHVRTPLPVGLPPLQTHLDQPEGDANLVGLVATAAATGASAGANARASKVASPRGGYSIKLTSSITAAPVSPGAAQGTPGTPVTAAPPKGGAALPALQERAAAFRQSFGHAVVENGKADEDEDDRVATARQYAAIQSRLGANAKKQVCKSANSHCVQCCEFVSEYVCSVYVIYIHICVCVCVYGIHICLYICICVCVYVCECM
jgi:hypothetical protein